VLAAVVLGASESGPTLAHDALANLRSTGVENPVTAVLMAFRATDTLLEKIVLVLAVLAVWSLAPDSKWGGRPGPKERIDPDGVLPFLARVLPPFGVVVGIYLVWVSSSEPGGAFQGSTLLAAMWLLVMMAGLAEKPATKSRRLRLAVLVGPVFFLAVGLAGQALAGAFLSYPIAWAKTLIVAIEVPMLLSLAAMLGLLVLGAPNRSGDE
jgi:multisubunit Na+/H+ antiporter MnhB subunit